MIKKNDWLLESSKDVTSQAGEDGVIEKIFEVIPQTNPWCIDIGAWDGKNYSNVYNLLKNRKWSGVMIETNTDRFKELEERYKNNEKVTCLNKHVSFEGEQSLDKILAETKIPKEFSLLNIDIDGNDYHLWESLKEYRPIVVCIEFNPTIPNHISFIQPRDINVNQGNSLRALNELAKEKGYELICATRLNAFFVDKKYFVDFEIADNSLSQLYKDTEKQASLFYLYDGTMVVHGNKMISWHGIMIDEKKIQAIPKFFRVFPSVMSKKKLFLFKVWRKIKNHDKELWK